MHVRAKAAVAAVVGASAIAATAGIGTAIADPPSGKVPASTDWVGVGSDTIQYLLDGFSKQYNSAVKTGPRLYSWDAFVPGSNPPVVHDSIQAKSPSYCKITRPNGSSEGISALSADYNAVASGSQPTRCIDFARASRPLASTDPSNLVAYALGRDGVTWAAEPGGAAPATLTPQQLQAIYSCTDTNWSQVGGPNAPIHAYLPQSGSGTRKFFMTAIGISSNVPGSCVITSDNPPTEENDGQILKNDPDALLPFSIASFIAQTNKVIPDLRGGVTLREITDGGTVYKPTKTTSTGKQLLNPGFDPTFLRLVYDVVVEPNGQVPQVATTLFAPGGFFCAHQATVLKYGFAKLGSACGATSTP